MSADPLIHDFFSGDKDKLQEEVVVEEVGAVVAAGVEVVLEEGAVQAVEEVVLQEAVVGLEAEEGGFRLLLSRALAFVLHALYPIEGYRSTECSYVLNYGLWVSQFYSCIQLLLFSRILACRIAYCIVLLCL